MRKYYTVNEDQAFKDWSQTISEATGLDSKNPRDSERIAWMSTMMAINARIDEGYGSQVPGQMPGMGAAQWPSDPGLGVGAKDGAFFDPAYKRGSGDIPGSKLGIAMNVASYTIGLELLPVIPMEFPTMMYSYLDHLYADGAIDSADNKPSYVMFSGGTIGTAAFDYSKFAKGDIVYIDQIDDNGGADDAFVAGTPAIKAVFYGRHRLTGNVILKIESAGTTDASGAYTADSTKSVGDIITAAFVGAADKWVLATGDDTGLDALTGTTPDIEFTDGSVIGTVLKAELVNSMDEHISEYSNPAADVTLNGPSRISATRAEGEKGTQNAISLKLFSTSVEAGTVEVIANITRTQLKDLSSYGIDGLSQVYSAAQNELTQTINRDVLRTMFRLGVTSHAQLKAAQGMDLNLFLADAGTASKALSTFGLKEFVDITGTDRSADFPAVKNGETNSSAESLYTRQRRIASRILLAANTIATVGRHGKGDFAVVNTQVASAIQDNKGFVAAPFENTISVQTKNLYFVGTMQGGVSVYVDPTMPHFDTRILVGRKGTEDDPGLKFFVYQLAESIEAISEVSMSPKIAVTSRYSLVPAGFYPEAQYLTFAAYQDFSDNTWS